jgi:diadenosine tetraphosphate (Ap4A) HIT family hydrolase
VGFDVDYVISLHMPCLICDRVKAIREGKNPLFVAELSTGYVVLGDFQYWRGYTLFLYKHHVAELHDLETNIRLRFLEQMSIVAEAVYRAFLPSKLNYELLGNSEPHLHWHLFPRREDEPNPKQPVWVVDKSLRYAESARPSDSEVRDLKRELLRQLTALGAMS